MRLLVGLGNPGAQYDRTRHNIGFSVVEEIRCRYQKAGSGLWRTKFQSEMTEVEVGNESIVVLRPQTYMNRSGDAVGECMGFYKISPASILVVHDEIDLPLGAIRVKSGGGDAGHNGIKSIAHVLGTKDFGRVRVGVGRPDNPAYEIADWVLGRFSSPEEALVRQMTEDVVAMVPHWVSGGVALAARWVSRQVTKPG